MQEYRLYSIQDGSTIQVLQDERSEDNATLRLDGTPLVSGHGSLFNLAMHFPPIVIRATALQLAMIMPTELSFMNEK